MALAERAGRSALRVSVPNNPTFSPTAGGTVPIYFDNNGNGTYEAGIDVAYDNRFATGGTYHNYATYINDGLSTPSPLFQGGTTGANTDLSSPTSSIPSTRSNRGTRPSI